MAGNHTPTTVELANAVAVSTDKPLFFFLERYAAAYRAELEAFLKALAGNKPMPVGAEDGRRAILLAEAAARSLRRGVPVALVA
jgi:myo-inositol 2-dehydrogenase/D-chiro-inositol 1-dehydrogenase